MRPCPVCEALRNSTTTRYWFSRCAICGSSKCQAVKRKRGGKLGGGGGERVGPLGQRRARSTLCGLQSARSVKRGCGSRASGGGKWRNVERRRSGTPLNLKYNESSKEAKVEWRATSRAQENRTASAFFRANLHVAGASVCVQPSQRCAPSASSSVGGRQPHLQASSGAMAVNEGAKRKSVQDAIDRVLFKARRSPKERCAPLPPPILPPTAAAAAAA